MGSGCSLWLRGSCVDPEEEKILRTERGRRVWLAGEGESKGSAVRGALPPLGGKWVCERRGERCQMTRVTNGKGWKRFLRLDACVCGPLKNDQGTVPKEGLHRRAGLPLALGLGPPLRELEREVLEGLLDL